MLPRAAPAVRKSSRTPACFSCTHPIEETLARRPKRQSFVRKLVSAASIAAAFIGCALAGGMTVVRADTAQNHTVVARSSNDALVIWDATGDVGEIVQAKLDDVRANARLEHDALRALAAKMPLLDKSSRSVNVRVVYGDISALNSEYGSPTFASVNRYALVKLDPKDAFGNRDHWMTLPAGAPIPGWIRFTQLGRLPPR
jgi:hypothetical protein